MTNRIELSLQLGKLRKQAGDLATLIDREQSRLLQMYYIPGNQMEAEQSLSDFQRFQADCYEVSTKVSRLDSHHPCQMAGSE